MDEIIFHNDPSDPLFGQTTVVQHPDPPAAVHVEDVLTFKRRFTVAERVAIRAAKASDAIVADFMDLLDTAAAVNAQVRFDAADLLAGVNYLKTAGILTASRAAQILTP